MDKNKRSYASAVVAVPLVLLASWALFGELYTPKKAKEDVLRQHLYTIRSSIDQYTLDKSRRPQSTTELIAGGYLKRMPNDPITGRDDTWVVEWSTDPKLPGIVGINSGSLSKSSKGNRYSEW